MPTQKPRDEPSVRLLRDQYTLLRQLATIEERSLRSTLERCLRAYAQQHQPQILKEKEHA